MNIKEKLKDMIDTFPEDFLLCFIVAVLAVDGVLVVKWVWRKLRSD